MGERRSKKGSSKMANTRVGNMNKLWAGKKEVGKKGKVLFMIKNS